jgi:hypothetical protein
MKIKTNHFRLVFQLVAPRHPNDQNIDGGLKLHAIEYSSNLHKYYHRGLPWSILIICTFVYLSSQ